VSDDLIEKMQSIGTVIGSQHHKICNLMKKSFISPQYTIEEQEVICLIPLRLLKEQLYIW